MKNIEEQIKIISKGSSEIINIDELKEKLLKCEKESRALTVKLGLDPSAPDIHIGHAVVLRKLKQLQELGHNVVLIIGDFTGMIGDPTGKSKTRKQLTREEVLANALTYEKQIFKILDKEKTELRFNSEWLSKLNFKDVIELSSKYTVARMLEREDFKNRFNNQLSIGIHEFFYPLMQAYDSVAIKADIELGGTDQKFNILMGRTLQKEYKQESQIAIFMPILEGIDGKDKMSKSLGNYVGINEVPNDMYIKVMQIPDNLIIKYFELATDIYPDEINNIKVLLAEDKANPRDIKMRLAKEIVSLYHGLDNAVSAEVYFKELFQTNNIPENIPTITLPPGTNLIDAVAASSVVSSKSEARRLINQGGVKINNNFTNNNNYGTIINNGDTLQIGKRNYFKVIIQSK